MELASRVNRLIEQISYGVYERDDTFRLCLLASLAGESVFLLGPPGIGKSLIAKRIMSAFSDGNAFEYLMTRFSTPEEVFGPLSIQALKDEGKYIRLTDGYLPTANVVFLDEIWKAGPAILNTLLTVINEKRYRNGTQSIKVPMRLLIAASNELPEADSGLEALYDRILIRAYVSPVKQRDNFRAMIEDQGNIDEFKVPSSLKVSSEEFQQWQEQLASVSLPENCFDMIFWLKTRLEQVNQADDESDAEIYVSDRRWKKAIRLLRASAFFNGRSQISPTDLLILLDCLWHDLESREQIDEIIREYALEHAYHQQELQQAIIAARGQLQYLKTQLENVLALTFKDETQLSRQRYRCNALSRATLYTFQGKTAYFKLVFTDDNRPISSQVKENAGWAYVKSAGFEKALRKGEATIEAHINGNPKVAFIQLSLDGDLRLVAKDTENRSIVIGIIGTQLITEEERQQRQQQRDAMTGVIEQLDQQLRAQQHLFASALPHNFASPTYIKLIESSLHSLQDEFCQLKTDFSLFNTNHKRLRKAISKAVKSVASSHE